MTVINGAGSMKRFLLSVIFICFMPFILGAQEPGGTEQKGFVAVVRMRMMILPGTEAYLRKSIVSAAEQGASAVVVWLDTPGGVLETSQQMIQQIFKAPVPVIIYVAPSGAMAASAGVFITMAGHVAGMAPGTSIGAAHPVSGDGKNLESDMRTKAENLTVAMIKSISDQRGRNTEWAEKSVKESSSLTEKEALEKNVIDFVAPDLDSLLKQVKGKQIKLDNGTQILEDLSALPRREFEMAFREKTLNVLSNPNVAALLWLGATTGLSIELYNPGAILPGVVGVICLILGLAVSQIIPINTVGVLLLMTGAALIGAELFIPSGILGVGGVIAMVLGAIYLIDVGEAPGLAVSLGFLVPISIALGGLMLFIVSRAVRVLRSRPSSGYSGLIGQHGTVTETVSKSGRIFVNGEIWNATAAEGVIEKDAHVEVLSVREGMVLVVRRV